MRVDELERYAKALGVKVSDLLGETAQSEREAALLELFRKLPDTEQDRAIKVIRALAPANDG